MAIELAKIGMPLYFKETAACCEVNFTPRRGQAET